MAAWVSDLERVRSRGVITHRVHVVTLPLSEYMHYEIDAYKITKEDVRFIERGEYLRLEKIFNPKEFWLIDEKHLFTVNYDPEGHWTGFDYSGEEAELQTPCANQGFLLSKALPLDSFARDNGIKL